MGRRKRDLAAQFGPERTPMAPIADCTAGAAIAAERGRGSTLELPDIGVTVEFSDEDAPAALDAIVKLLADD